MSTKHTTTHHVKGGPTYRTTTTSFKDGGSKSVTRTGGNVFSGGKVTQVTTRDSKGNSRTVKS